MTQEKVIITKDEYIRLRRDSDALHQLEIGGVDNWEWYGESFPDDWEPYEFKEGDAEIA